MHLAGELAKMNLASLIKLVRNGELTGRISLTQGINTAFIYFDGGHPVHIEGDFGTGKEALLELFLWVNGTFSYTECSVADVPRSLPADEPLEKLLKEGFAYQEAVRFLNERQIAAQTILKADGAYPDDPFLSRMDGKTALAEIVQSLGMSRLEYVLRLKPLVAAGKTRVHQAPPQGEAIQLPDWVVSRLKQDNEDVSQAIVQLVIWADRIKCWLYQADVDLERIISALDKSAVESGSVSEANFAPGTSVSGSDSLADVADAVGLSRQSAVYVGGFSKPEGLPDQVSGLGEARLAASSGSSQRAENSQPAARKKASEASGQSQARTGPSPPRYEF